jgi:CHAT domain-containing protein/Tfp pilus assembly protein PilF
MSSHLSRPLALLLLTILLSQNDPSNTITAQSPTATLPAQQSKALSPEQEKELSVAKELYAEAERLYKQNDYEAAIPLMERVLPMLEKVLGDDHEYVIVTLNNLVAMQQAKNNFPEVERLLRRILVSREKTRDPNDPAVADVLTDFGSMYYKKGEYTEAEPPLRRALEIYEQVFGKDHPKIASALNALALIIKAKGDYEKAEALYTRALALKEKQGPLDLSSTQLLNNLAALYRTTGNYQRAQQLYLQALAIREKVVPPNDISLAGLLNNLATLYREQGDYVKAEQYFLRALEIREKALRPDQSNIATSLANLASLYHEKGDYARAEQMYQRALVIINNAYGPDHISVANVLGGLARIKLVQGDADAAEALLTRALSIRERRLGPTHPSIATVLDGLCFTAQAKGQLAECRPLLERALGIRILKYGEEHRTVALSLLRLGNLMRAQSSYPAALSFFKRAQGIIERKFGPNYPLLATVLGYLALVYEAQGDFAQALSFQSQSDEIRERRLALILSQGSDAQKRLYLATVAGQTSISIWLQTQVAPPQSGEATRLALTNILRRKGRALDAMAYQMGTLRRRLSDEDTALLDQLTRAQAELANSVLAAEGESETATPRPERLQLESNVDRLEAQVSARGAKLNEQLPAVTLEAVQRLIPDDAALVEISLYWPYQTDPRSGRIQWGASRYVAYVLHHNGEPAFVDLGETKPIDQSVLQLREALGDPRRLDVKDLARVTYNRVWRSLHGRIGKTRQILISPEGALNLLPFAALVNERGEYLVQQNTFVYLTSGRDLIRLKTHSASRQPPVIIANPLFDPPASSNNSAKAEPHSGSRLQVLIGRFDALDGTSEEAHELGGLLNVDPLLEDKANESALKQVHGPRILHIATHGFFLTQQLRGSNRPEEMEQLQDLSQASIFDVGENTLLRSGLALYGANQLRGGGNEDGILTALEVSGLDLVGTKLVTLSACKTGLGDVQAGEGLYGLRRALVIAGAESQVISLWQADADVTTTFMGAYYRDLKDGLGRADAMRKVQLEMLENPEQNHPYFWACFIQSGEWRSLSVN